MIHLWGEHISQYFYPLLLVKRKQIFAVRRYTAIPDWQSYEDIMQQYKENCLRNYVYKRQNWRANLKKNFVSVMNMLLIYLFVSLMLEKWYKNNYLALVIKLCYHYDILRNREILYGTVD